MVNKLSGSVYCLKVVNPSHIGKQEINLVLIAQLRQVAAFNKTSLKVFQGNIIVLFQLSVDMAVLRALQTRAIVTMSNLCFVADTCLEPKGNKNEIKEITLPVFVLLDLC